MKQLTLVTLALLCCTGPLSAQVKQTAADPDLVFFSDDGPVLFRLAIRVDGQTFAGQSDPYLTKWFNKLDRDKDGMLSEDEIKVAPNSQAMNTIVRGGYYYPQAATNLSLQALRKNAGDKVSLTEFLDYYRNAGIYSLQMAPAYNPNSLSPQASTRLFAMLDTNGDGKISETEMASSLSRIGKLDGNEDDYLDSSELSGIGLGNPYYSQLNQFNPKAGQTDEFFVVDTEQKRVQLTALLLAKLDRDKDVKVSRTESMLNKIEFNKLDRNGDNHLDIDELGRWSQVRTPITLDISLNSNDNSGKLALATGEAFLPKGVSATQVNDQSIQFGAGNAQVTINQVNGARVMMNSGAGQYYLQLYRSTSLRLKKQFLTREDLKDGNGRLLDGIFPLADDNADEKLTEDEITGFISFLSSGKSLNLSLSIQKEGRGLFQLLDANKDNRISLRELLNGWNQLKQADQNNDGYFTEGEVARQFNVALSQGSPYYGFQGGGAVIIRQPGMANPVPRVAAKGPLWFQRMDVNGDGDVSPREFLGSREVFDRLDTNNDGLLESQEAEAISEKSQPPSDR
jgi:Ca2+-binding EF-hand superfamily protein